MYRLVISTAALLLLTFSFSFCQVDKNLLSTTLNVELSSGSKFDTRPELIKKYNRLLDSFAVIKGYKLAKGNVEIFHTDYDSLKAKLNQQKFIIIREDNSDFYKITKGNNKYLAFISSSSLAYFRSHTPIRTLQISSVLSYLHVNPFGVTTTITIKRMY